METPLTPLDFARRARRLYTDCDAVVDGDQRFTYETFFDRCDRWSAALQSLGIRPGDRVAYIAPNTHAQLESFYAVPQTGAVLVPINYRLAAQDFAYMIQQSGARVVCAHPDYFGAIDSIRAEIPGVEHFVALGGMRPRWLDYEQMIAGTAPAFAKSEIGENDLLTINYTSGTTSRPKGVMITHRNAYMNVVGTLLHFPMTSADRYLWTLPMFHANGWTFVWTVTAVGATHICLPRVDPPMAFERIARESVTVLCAAPTVLISLANASEEVRHKACPGIRVLTAGAPPAAATIQRIEGEFGWDVTHIYGMTETSPFISICEPRSQHAGLSPRERAVIKARQGVELITSGELRVLDTDGLEVPRDGETLGEIVARGNVVMKGYFQDPQATAHALRDGWIHTGDAAVVHPDGYVEIRDRLKDGCNHQRRRKHFFRGSREHSAYASGRARSGRRRSAARKMGRGAACFCCPQEWEERDRNGIERIRPREHGPFQGSRRVHHTSGTAQNRDRQFRSTSCEAAEEQSRASDVLLPPRGTGE